MQLFQRLGQFNPIITDSFWQKLFSILFSILHLIYILTLHAALELLKSTAEGTWSTQPGEEEPEGRLHCSYKFLLRGRGAAGTDLLSGTQGQDPKEWPEAVPVGYLCWALDKGSSPRGWFGTGTGSLGKWSQHQAWQSSEVFGQCS